MTKPTVYGPSYSAYVRATDAAGTAPRRLPKTAGRAFRVR